MIGGFGAPVDAFRVEGNIWDRQYNNLSGRALVDPRLDPGERTMVFIAAGQSNITNAATGGAYTPTSPKVQNLNFLNGGLYAAKDPMLGCGSAMGNWLGRFGDKLIAGGVCDRVIIVPVGVSSTSIAAWAPGGVLHDYLLVAVRRCDALGLPISGFLMQIGETDGQNGMPQATFKSHMESTISGVRAQGWTAPWFVGKSTYVNGTTYSAIRSAVDSVVNGTDIFAGGDTDTLTGSTYRETANNIHFNATGCDAAANLWKAAVDAVL